VSRARIAIAASLLAAALACAPAAADPIADFYRGRTVTMIVPADATGGEAQYALLVARFLRDHLPGRPAIVPQYLPGAAGARGAGYFSTVAPQDGSVFAAIAPTGPLYQRLLGPAKSGFRLDFAQARWLGRVVTTESVLMGRAQSGLRSIADLQRLGAIACAPAAADAGALDARALAAATGAAIRVVKGYPGTRSMVLAFARGECSLLSLPWTSWRLNAAALIVEGGALSLAQVAAARAAMLPALPTVAELAPPALRPAIALLGSYAAIGRAYALAPGVPDARAAALRRAFEAALADPAMAADAKARGMDFAPAPGGVVRKYVMDTLTAPADVVAKARAILGL